MSTLKIDALLRHVILSHCKGDENFSSVRTKYNTTFITAAIVSAIVAIVVTEKPNTRGGRR